MATPRNVTITIKHPDNSVWADGPVTFELEMVSTDGTTTYPAYVYSLTTNGSGTATASLMPGDYTLTLPSGERLRITIPVGTGALDLTALITGRIPALDDERWAAYKDAVKEYSRYRPRLVPGNPWDPADGVVEQPAFGTTGPGVPAGVIGARYVNWGEEVSLEEIITATATEQGWCFANDKLYLTPAPVAGDAIIVIWEMEHVPDETTQTCTTIPQRDEWLIELLTDANVAQTQQAAVESGLSSYTIGGTTVRWSQPGGAGTSGTTRAQRLRAEALTALREPLASWG
jgi:hypothetical protein